MKLKITELLHDKKLEKTIKNIGKIAEDNKIAVYIVGGVVRDALLNRPITDLDIVVIGDGIKFAELVAKHFKIKTIIKYGKFGTAMIPMKNLTLE
ncbi:MAG: tRNA nucleotidyltransferase, partial [Candidatus Marinimicrobia bacterium]|nr:tRNA nucleotidyltransferase [Candidatus Neomarinimicrobiota bacterium]